MYVGRENCIILSTWCYVSGRKGQNSPMKYNSTVHIILWFHSFPTLWKISFQIAHIFPFLPHLLCRLMCFKRLRVCGVHLVRLILTSTRHLHYCLYSFAEATNQILDVKNNKNINSTMTTLAIAWKVIQLVAYGKLSVSLSRPFIAGTNASKENEMNLCTNHCTLRRSGETNGGTLINSWTFPS